MKKYVNKKLKDDAKTKKINKKRNDARKDIFSIFRQKETKEDVSFDREGWAVGAEVGAASQLANVRACKAEPFITNKT